MCIFSCMTGQYGASAKVADGRLVLSLQDAETPVIWILDLADTPTAVLRLESDKSGLYVIKKFGGKGAAETVAVYKDRKKAARALHMATRALEKARNSRASNGAMVMPPRSKFMRVFTFLLYAWFAFYLINFVVHAVGNLMFLTGGGLPGVTSAVTSEAPVAAPLSNTAAGLFMPTAPGTAPAPSAPAALPQAGLPQSADEFLKSNSGTLRIP